MKPILFNTEMVQAIQDDRKINTRRCIKGVSNDYYFDNIDIDPCICFDGDLDKTKDLKGTYAWFSHSEYAPEFTILKKSPYQIGDVLYVRETWQLLPSGFDEIPPEMNYIYKATDELSDECTKWRPSIHMPKETARIFLKVTDVRVERLQDMRLIDFTNEGIVSNPAGGFLNQKCRALAQFKVLWNSTIKKQDLDKYGWNANPWIFVYEFERCEKE